MPTTIRGSEITPRLPDAGATPVAANKTYASGRNYEYLLTVGAITQLALEVARRTDGIIKNQPRDGKLHVDEMVQMEQTDYKATLFPEEKQQQPVLWKALELPDVPAATAPQVAELPPLASLIELQTEVPTGIDMNKSVPINQLNQSYQRLAQRIQLVLDHDDHPDTICLADINAAIAEPQRFLPEEQQVFTAIKAEIESLIRREPSAMKAQLVVPEPGTVAVALPHDGQVKFELRTRVTISDGVHVQRDHYGRSNIVEPPLATVTRQQLFGITVPAGHKAIIMKLDGEGETLLEAGTKELWLEGGKHRVELWKNGQRVQSSEVILPATRSQEVQNLDFQTGVPMVTSGGKKVVRVANGEQAAYNNSSDVTYRGEYVLETQAGSRQRQELAAYGQFNAALPAGVYNVPNRPEKVRVYDNRLVSVFDGSREIFLRPSQGGYVRYATGSGSYARDLYMAMGQVNGDPNQAYLNLWISGSHVGSIRITERVA